MTVFMILTCYISLSQSHELLNPLYPDDVDHFLFNVLYKTAVLVCIFFKLSIKADVKLLCL